MVWCGVVWSTWPSRVMWHMHAPTFNEWQKKKTKKKVTYWHMLTHGTMQGCGLTSLVVCINDKTCDVKERNVTIRSAIWTTHIRSLGFRDIREWVTLWKLILQSLGCKYGYVVDLKLSCSYYRYKEKECSFNWIFHAHSKSKPLVFWNQSLGPMYEDLVYDEDPHLHCLELTQHNW